MPRRVLTPFGRATMMRTPEMSECEGFLSRARGEYAGNGTEAGGLADRLQQAHLPVCPQMRPAGTLWRAVEGYCVFDCAPGRHMIPSVEEFRNWCTTQQFHQCPWFGVTRDGAGAPMTPRSRPPIRTGTWLAPDTP